MHWSDPMRRPAGRFTPVCFGERNGTRKPTELHRWVSCYMRFSDAIEQFIKWKQINVSRATIDGYSLDLRNFCLYMRNPEIETINAHSYRHRFGLELAKQGANNSVISNLLGHASLTSSFRYTMMRDNQLAEEYQKYRVGKIKSR